MKYLSVLLVSVFIMACSNNNEELPVNDAHISTIEHVLQRVNWMETFNYDNDERLISVDNSSTSGGRKEFVYEGNNVTRINHIELSTDTIHQIDSLTYNNEGNLISFNVLSAYPGPGFSEVWSYEFEYDDNGRVSKQTSFFDRSGEDAGYIIFEWTGDNIRKLNYFNQEDDILYEYFYEYDNKLNYAQGIPIYIQEPLYWNRNNITKFDYIDHTGLLDLACGPCTYEFEYNEDDYPSEIEYNWGYTKMLTYK